jgi:hypothetical protein
MCSRAVKHSSDIFDHSSMLDFYFTPDAVDASWRVQLTNLGGKLFRCKQRHVCKAAQFDTGLSELAFLNALTKAPSDSESSIAKLSWLGGCLLHLFILFILSLSELSEIRAVTSPMHLFFIRYRLGALVTWIGRELLRL